MFEILLTMPSRKLHKSNNYKHIIGFTHPQQYNHKPNSMSFVHMDVMAKVLYWTELGCPGVPNKGATQCAAHMEHEFNQKLI